MQAGSALVIPHTRSQRGLSDANLARANQRVAAVAVR
jgi:hypothetical protein